MNKKTEARCNGLMLTVGFHAADPPLVWRFDLERNHSFTLAMQGEEGDWELGVTSPKGDFHPVAHFATREDAEDALIKVEKALASGRGAWSLIKKALLILGGLAVAVFLAVTLFGLVVGGSTHKNMATSFAPSPQTAPEGVPLSADDVLKPPR